MNLSSVEIEGFRSIKEKMHFFLDSNVTAILGANDHGKSNLLQALLFLNEDEKFNRDIDLNWDYEKNDSEFPEITYKYTLNESEKENINDLINHEIKLAHVNKEIDEYKGKVSKVESNIGHLSDDSTAIKAEISSLEAQIKQAKNDGNSEVLATSTTELESKNVELSEIEAKTSHAEKEHEESSKYLFSAELERIRIGAKSDKPINEILQGFLKNHEELTLKSTALQKDKAKIDASITQFAAQNDQPNLTKQKDLLSSNAKEISVISQQLSDLAIPLKILQEIENYFGDDIDFLTEVTEYKYTDIIFGTSIDYIEFQRKGVDSDLYLITDIESDEYLQYIFSLKPTVEIIHSLDTINDSITFDELMSEDNQFMQGIFYYAGLDPTEWEEIFKQTNTTTKRLQTANIELNKIIKEDWSQGKDLTFFLDHQDGKINLIIDDPSIKTRHGKPSQRSSGFTNYFSTKTILYARQRNSGSNSFIWLFDEPGLYLHPSGQYDLMRVMETLSKENQCIYTTHSIFLINKNHPIRHRLLYKDENGTKLDGKPFKGQWKTALEMLGVSLTGSILFPSNVLFVEGDSDPIYLYALFQKLISLEVIDVDINELAIIPTNDSKNAHVLLEIYLNSLHPPKMMALFDGDAGGKKRKKDFEALSNSDLVVIEILQDDCEIEDYLISIDELFLKSIGEYSSDYWNDPDKNFTEKIIELFKEEKSDFDPKKSTEISKWAYPKGKELGAWENNPSKLAIARKYSQLLYDDEYAPTKKAYERSKQLINKIISKLELRPSTEKQDKIIDKAS